MLSRDQILGADDLKTSEVSVPEWGGVVRVKMMTAGERDEWEALVYLDKKGGQEQSPKDIRAKLVVFTCVDEQGARLFTVDDIPALTKKSAVAMNRLWAAASKMNRVMAADVTDLEKN